MEYPKDFINKIICGDCLELLNYIPSNSIDLVVTSPPYDGLRDYTGFKFDAKKTIDSIYRVVKPGGVVVWVVADQTINGSETGSSFEQALHAKTTGFSLHDTMIYEKAGAPFPSKVRYYSTFEYMFIFSKGKPKTINLIADKKNKWGGEYTFGNSSNRNKDGELVASGKRKIKEYGVRNNIWRYASGYGFGQSDKRAFKHPAVFPEQLARDHIISWSNPGDLVLDPMAGSGTTLIQASLLDRNFIGIEISTDYCKLIEERLNENS